MIRPICATFLTFAGIPLLLADAPASPAPSSTPPPPAPVQEQLLHVPEPGRFKPLFQPFRTDTAALSPDGKYLAYSVRDGSTVSVVVLEIDHPDKIKARVQVVDDESATPVLADNQREATPGRIRWMRWVTPTRVLVETNRVFPGTDGGWHGLRGAILGFDADGANARVLATPKDLPEFDTDVGDTGGMFSSVRGNGSGFDRRVWSVDQPVVSQGGTSTSIELMMPSLTGSDNPALGTSPVFGVTRPRSFHVFDLDAQHPGAVTLLATGTPRNSGSHSIDFFSLDAQTGRLKNLAEDMLLSTDTALTDRQGRLRLTLHNTLLSKFPFRYQYLGLKGRNRPQPLDDATGLTGFSVSPENFFGARAIPIGFDENSDLLYYASNLGRDTYGIYSFNLATKQRGSLAMENPAYDLIAAPAGAFPDQRSLVFDRFTHTLIGVRYDNALRTTAWARPLWKELQAGFEKMLPGRTVEITDWDEAGKRFLVRTEGPADPGAFHLYDRERNKLMEFVRRAPWVDASHTHLSYPFSYATPDGARISGLVTAPRHPRLKPIPMVVLCPDWPWLRVHSEFQTEVQALADMGFVVVQLNGRGAWGLGLKQRQSLTQGYDAVQVEDIVTTVANLQQLFQVNPQRVALFGRGHGGFIALRALQTYPEKFRCAVALDAPVDLAGWLAAQKWSDDDIRPHLTRAWLGDEARLKAAPLYSHPETLKKPVLMLNYPGPDGAPRLSAYGAAFAFASRVRAHGTAVEFDDLTTDYMQGLPAARAAVFDRIEAFLDLNVYDFNVKLHDIKVVD